jgi:hypothetical protein
MGEILEGKLQREQMDKWTNGQKGDPVLMKHLESIGLVDDILSAQMVCNCE